MLILCSYALILKAFAVISASNGILVFMFEIDIFNMKDNWLGKVECECCTQ